MGDWWGGGLIGADLGGSASTSYAVGEVTGVTASNTTACPGGLVGYGEGGGTFTACYWDTGATSQTASAGGTGKTTAEMKEQATFVGWDFITVWDIVGSVNNGYPFLRHYTAAPNKAAIPNPADEATGQSPNSALTWQDGGGATSYDVYLGTTNPPVTRVASSRMETAFSPTSPLRNSTTYFWRVDAKNYLGTTTGDVWRFTTARGPAVWTIFSGLAPEDRP